MQVVFLIFLIHSVSPIVFSKRKADTVGCVCHTLYLHNQRSSLFHGAQATGANVDRLATIQSDFANVGLPGSVGFPIGMGHILTEHDAFSANITLCHWLTPPFTHHIERHRKQHLPFHTVTLYHTKIENAICTAKIFRVF